MRGVSLAQHRTDSKIPGTFRSQAKCGAIVYGQRSKLWTCALCRISPAPARNRGASTSRRRSRDPRRRRKSLLGKAHTVVAEGGIAAAVGSVDPRDNWRVHFRDTMAGGKYVNGLEKSTVSRIAAMLEGRSWVRRVRDERDARFVRLHLTRHGIKANARIAESRRAKFERIFSAIPSPRRRAIVESLSLLLEVTREG